jgi:hypothetical protein
MDPITQQQALAAAGAAGSDPVYVDDVFSTYLYDGNASTQTITNGINLSGEGGLVWLKNRDAAERHSLQDTERGVNKLLDSSDSIAEVSITSVNSFNSDGFGLNSSNSIFNGSGADYASWTFRKCPGFFDVVTWNGNGTNGRTVSHNLGSVPGMIIIKSYTHSTFWAVYHRGIGEGQYLFLNTSSEKSPYDSSSTNSRYFNNTAPTSTEFTLSDDGWVNGSGNSYVAYIFAHNEQSFGTDSDEAIIKCDGYTGNGTSGNEINVGFEPQWLMIKRTSGSQDWMMFDNMRGIATSGNDAYLEANNTIDEQTADDFLELTATGFKIRNTNTVLNGNGDTYIYVAIRRPNKPPESATDVFAIDTMRATTPNFVSGFVADAALRKPVANSYYPQIFSRLTGGNYLQTATTGAEQNYGWLWDYMNGFDELSNSADSNIYSWMFKRAPGFFDVVIYEATGGNTTNNVAHNLGVAPEMIWVKKRGATSSWPVYHTVTGTSTSTRLHIDTIDQYASSYWSSAPSATHFYPYGSDTNANAGDSWIAYLFATLPGISKVGSYTGTGSDGLQVDCGFTNGARFVLIKRADGTGPWYLFDSARGIVSGNDPYIQLNVANAQLSNNDIVDPYSPGFIVNAVGSGINAAGGTYLFLAIA